LVFVVCGVMPSQQSDERSMSLGVDSMHTVAAVCLMLGARAVAGDFFKDLRTRGTRKGLTFNRHGKEIKSFPARLIVKFDAAFDRCVGKGPPDCDRCDFRLSREFMSSLQFEAYWKHGFDAEQKAAIEERSNDLAQVAPSAGLWKYELSIKSENIPLTDSLVVVVLSPDQRIVSRLSARR